MSAQGGCKTASCRLLYENALKEREYTFCIAPMMDWTDRHCRVFHRLLTRRARLYTEMITANAVIHGDRDRLIGFSEMEHPVALQLGGGDASPLAKAAEIAQAAGYDEVNLNVGCPSDRVKDGRFGACLMAEPERVAACVAAMQAEVDIPVTVKCRIGIDEQDSEQDFQRFIDTVAAAGCRVFIVHARKAWLNGLSPKQNRDVPPLDYDRVYRLKAAHPELTIVINGGIETLDECERHIKQLDGVMLGRAAYHTPFILADVDRRLFDADTPLPSRSEVLSGLIDYTAQHLKSGGSLNNITRHILGLMHGKPRARAYRRLLSGAATADEPGLEKLEYAIELARMLEFETDDPVATGATSTEAAE